MIAPLLDSAPYVSYRSKTGCGPLFVWPHIQDWFCSWVPDSVFIAGKGASSADAWYATTLDIEEVFGNTRQGDFHIFVADVVKSFDTVDRDILDCALGRLGLPAWFRRLGYGLSLLLVLGLRGPGMEASPKDAHSVWSLLLRFTLLGAGI